ncbi:hypothetical protein EV284_0373 [Streptomyces sp. BK022]|nr:hypothetical protein EV284_0373 [Streptomyces sp. BK022]
MPEIEQDFEDVDVCDLSEEALDDIVGGGLIVPMTSC